MCPRLNYSLYAFLFFQSVTEIGCLNVTLPFYSLKCFQSNAIRESIIRGTYLDLLVASHLITPFVQDPAGIVHIHWIPRAPKTFVSIYEKIIKLLLLRKYFAEDRDTFNFVSLSQFHG